MKTLCLPNDQLYKYRFTGKFQAPSAHWKHETFNLAEYELIVVTEGTLYLNYDHEDFTVQQGEYLLLEPTSSQRKGFKESYCAFYWVHFSTDAANIPMYIDAKTEKSYEGGLLLPQTGSIPRPEKIVILMKQLQDIAKSNYPQVALNAMTTTIFAELYAQISMLPQINITNPEQKQIYNDIIDFIHQNIAQNLKVADVAAAFGYNEKYLSHRFIEITGVPLKQFITSEMINMANMYLTDTNNTIVEIAKDLGFSDAHNFSRAYKKATGLTPSDFRNAYSKRLLFDR